MNRSWKPEVIADSSGKWCGNAVRFATKAEAETSAYDLAMRWTAVRDWRVTESEDPVNYRIVDGRMESVKYEQAAEQARMPDGSLSASRFIAGCDREDKA